MNHVEVLHVDDDDMVLEFVKEFVTQAEPEILITSVESPREALELLHSRKFDCIVSDYRMPNIDGLAFAAEVRRFSDTPIILYTGQGSEEVAERAFAIGVDDYIRKENHPAHYQVLAKRIRQAVEKRRADIRAKLYEEKLEALYTHILVLQRATGFDDVCKATLDAAESVMGLHLLAYLQVQGDVLTSIGNRGSGKLSLSLPLDGKGITVKAAREQRSILVNDLRSDPDFVKGNADSLSELVVPVIVDGETFGVINVESLESNFFSDEDRRLLEIFANHVSLTIKRLGMLESERSNRGKLEALQLNAIKLSQAGTIDEALDTTCEILGNEFSYDWVGIGKVGEEAIHYIKGIGINLVGNDEIPLDLRSITVRAVKSGETQLVPDTSIDGDYMLVNPGDAKASSELVVPIHVNGRVEFVINLESNICNAFSEEDQHLIELLSLHLGSAVRLIRKREKLTSLHLHASHLALSTDIEDIAKLTLATLRDVLDFKLSSFHIVKRDVTEVIANIGFKVEGRFTQALDGPGLIPYAVRECRSVYAPDITRDEHYVKSPLNPGDERSSAFVAPIIIDGVPVAAIYLEDKRVNGFTDDDRELVELLAEHVASAIQRNRLLESIRSHAINLEALQRHAANLLNMSTIDEVARCTFDIIENVLNVSDGAIGFVEGDALIFKYAKNVSADQLPVLPLDGAGISVRAVRTGETQLVHDTQSDSDFVFGYGRTLSELDVPVKIDGRVVAVINLEDPKPNAFSEEEKTVVEILSEHVATVISRIEQLGVIRASEEKYRRVLDSSLDSVLLMSGTKIIYTNEIGAKLLGYDSVSELIGRDFLDMLPEEEKDLIRQRTLSRQRGESQPNTYELRLLRKDGTIVEVEAAVSLTEIEGKPAILAFARDISDRKLYQTKLVQLHGSAKRLAGASTRDEVWDIAMETVSQILGFDFGGIGVLEGNTIKYVRNVGDDLPKDWRVDLSKPSITSRTIETGIPQLVRDTSLDPDYLFAPGTVRRGSELASPIIVDGQPVALLNIESNMISAFTEADLSLVQILVGQVSSAIDRITHGEEESRRRETRQRELLEGMERMSGMVRHDLRGPLQTIQSASYMLRRRPDRAEELTRRIDDGVEYAVRILDDLKAMTKPEALNKVSTNLGDLVEKSLDGASIPATVSVEKKLAPLSLEVDQYRIRRVVDNLVKNAVEAMPDGGTLTLKVEAVDGVALLTVRDSGRGITEEVGKNLFTPFYTTKSTGTGLGLVICRQIVEAHEGKIAFESRVGEGTTFTVALPLKQVSTYGNEAVSTSPMKSAGSQRSSNRTGLHARGNQ